MSTEKIIHAAVTSLPVSDTSWVDILSALLTPAIALIAVYIAFQQHKVDALKLRHKTYERRLRVYKSVQKYLSIILRDGKISYPQCSEFYAEASEASFLFDDSVQEYINTMYNKSIDMVHLHERMYPSDGSPGLPAGDERSKAVKDKSALLKWHTAQLKISKELFASKLGLKNA